MTLQRCKDYKFRICDKKVSKFKNIFFAVYTFYIKIQYIYLQVSIATKPLINILILTLL